MQAVRWLMHYCIKFYRQPFKLGHVLVSFARQTSTAVSSLCYAFTFAQFLWWAFRVSFYFCFRPHGVQGEAEVSQVSVSAGWQGHEEDVYFQRQRLHAAVCTAWPQAWVLVCRSPGEVSRTCTILFVFIICIKSSPFGNLFCQSNTHYLSIHPCIRCGFFHVNVLFYFILVRLLILNIVSYIILFFILFL